MDSKYFSKLGLVLAGIYAIVPVIGIVIDILSGLTGSFLFYLSAYPLWVVVFSIIDKPSFERVDFTGLWSIIITILYHLIVMSILYYIGYVISKHLLTKQN